MKVNLTPKQYDVLLYTVVGLLVAFALLTIYLIATKQEVPTILAGAVFGAFTGMCGLFVHGRDKDDERKPNE